LDEYEHSQEIPEEIARFVAMLEQYGIDPDGYVSAPDPGCIGGTRTEVSFFNTSDLEPHVIARMELDDCGATEGFDAEATAMISEWRAGEG
jgi:hypothetical protein